MIYTPDYLALLPDIPSKVGVSCVWRVRERDHRSGIIVAERKVKNIWTNYGLTALASGTIPSQTYLAVEFPNYTFSSGYSSGVTSITLSGQAHQTGDTQLILGVGLSSQETVTFSSATPGTGSTYVYTLSSPTAQPHNSGDPACRQVSATDTMSNVQNEQQYDAVNFPNQRMNDAGGYSNGSGNWTYQFYYPGPTLQTTLMIVGMTDNLTIGQGNLLNHFVLGYVHNNTNNDLEIDGSLTLSNI